MRKIVLIGCLLCSMAMCTVSLLPSSYDCFMAGYSMILLFHLLPPCFAYLRGALKAKPSPAQNNIQENTQLLSPSSQWLASQDAKHLLDWNGDLILSGLLISSLLTLGFAAGFGVPLEILPSALEVVFMCLLLPSVFMFRSQSKISRVVTYVMAGLFFVENVLYIRGDLRMRADSQRLLEDGAAIASKVTYKYLYTESGVAVKCDVSPKNSDYKTILIDSGLAFSAFAFEKVFAECSSPNVRLCALDRPGYGMSLNTGSRSRRGTAQVAQEIISVIETLVTNKLVSNGKVTLTGWSMGALNTAYAVHLRPDLVNELLLLSPVHPDFFDKIDGFADDVNVGISSFNAMKVVSPFGVPRLGCSLGIWPAESGSPRQEFNLSSASYDQMSQMFCGRHFHNVVAKELASMRESSSLVKEAVFSETGSRLERVHVVMEQMDEGSVQYLLAKDWSRTTGDFKFTQWQNCHSHYMGFQCVQDMVALLQTE
eukprot:TRINITY_DN386_c0_g1_i2.p1 TRINITY_DN386_c0_g1~~TRINITY_DN386_c0_g1_i2.p1  ORF type:complete len:483 (-),score=93.05 TRINITY_DN386_c0_g1_i2:102-1550(-)